MSALGDRGIDWLAVQRELVPSDTVREICSAGSQRGGSRPITRHTLIRWRRTRDFPEPVLTLQSRGQPLELWARSQVHAWLDDLTG